MSTRKARTTTVTTPHAIVTTSIVSPRRRAGGSMRQQKRAELLASIRLAYWGLSPQARNGFQRLCRQTPSNQVITKTGTRQKVTTFLFFSLLNQAARYAGAASAVTVPVDRPEVPNPIPSDVQLISAYDAQGRWRLTLTGAVYGTSLSVAFAPPAMEASNYRQSDFVQGEPVPGGVPTASGVDLTAQFLAIYPAAPLAGEKVAVQVMGVLPSGFATEKVSLPAFTVEPSAEDTGDGELRVA